MFLHARSGNTLEANEFQAARTKRKRTNLLPRGHCTRPAPDGSGLGQSLALCRLRPHYPNPPNPAAGPRMPPAPETAADRFFVLITRSELWPTNMLAGVISADFGSSVSLADAILPTEIVQEKRNVQYCANPVDQNIHSKKQRERQFP
jgi:hypothetical protein